MWRGAYLWCGEGCELTGSGKVRVRRGTFHCSGARPAHGSLGAVFTLLRVGGEGVVFSGVQGGGGLVILVASSATADIIILPLRIPLPDYTREGPPPLTRARKEERVLEVCARRRGAGVGRM